MYISVLPVKMYGATVYSLDPRMQQEQQIEDVISFV